MRIAFFVEGRTGWMAGHTYAHNLLQAIRLADAQVEVCLVRKPDDDASPATEALAKLVDQVLESPAARRWSLSWLHTQFRRIAPIRVSRDKNLDRFLAENRIDVAFGSWWQYPGYPVFPSVGVCAWIHDFQFLHFPHFYDTAEVLGSKRGILRMVDVADRLVVSSQDALKDLLSFAPEAAPKARVLPFVASIGETVYASNPEVVARRYNLPDKFIYLPNQLWQHKNHRLVLEALRILSGRGVRPCVVCTGLPHDPKKSGHFAELLTLIAEWGLHEQMRFLGLVPIDHVKALMRQAICVMNPSLFEGWSSTVEEAKSLGKGLLLSDLPVHREQNPPATTFFDPRDPDSLARMLHAIWQDSTPGPDLHLEAAARQALPSRMRQFGALFLTVAREAARPSGMT